MKCILWLFILMMLQGVTLAQQQDVAIAIVTVDNLPRIELSNAHALPVEAFLITSHYAGLRRLSDTIVYDVHLNYRHDLPIQPGSSQQIDLPHLADRELPAPYLRAVIFADGTTAGEKYWIQELLYRRKVLADNLERVMALLEDMATQKLTREQALAAMQAAWDIRIKEYANVTPEEREASERAFGSASSSLQFAATRAPSTDADFSKRLPGLIRGLGRWRDDIQSAKPGPPKPTGTSPTDHDQ